MNLEIKHQGLKEAVTSLIFSHPFFASILMNQEFVETRKIKTASVNGKQFKYNPDFIDKLDLLERRFLCAHEAGHLILMHHCRQGNREHKMWNKSCDLAINPLLKNTGFKLIDKEINGKRFRVLFETKFCDRNAEDIFRELAEEKRKEEEQKQNQKQQDKQNQEQKDENSQSSPDNGQPKKDNGEKEKDDQKPKESDKSEEKSEDNQKNDESNEEDHTDENENGEQKDDESENSEESQSKDETDSGENDEDSSNDSNSEGNEDELDDNEDQQEYDGTEEINEEEFGEVEESNDPLAEETIKIQTRQAQIIGQMAGDTSLGKLLEYIREAQKPLNDWREILNRYISDVCASDYSFSKVNKRHIGRGIILPTLHKPTIGKVICAIDCSGSISLDEVKKMVNEVRNCLDMMLEDKQSVELLVLYFDTVITNVQIFESDSDIIPEPKGGGGTEFGCVFKYIRDNDEEDCKALVLLTDGYCYSYGPFEPDYPVLFGLVQDNPSFKPPFGEVFKFSMTD